MNATIEWDDGDEEDGLPPVKYFHVAPDRGRIIIVNFNLAGTPVHPEIPKSGRPCVVIQNNKLYRGPLVTVIPLSTKAPDPAKPYHHCMSHHSFRYMPDRYGPQSTDRWAKCDYVTTVSLARCTDPYARKPNKDRQYVKIKATPADLVAIERCVIWGLGIRPETLVSTASS